MNIGYVRASLRDVKALLVADNLRAVGLYDDVPESAWKKKSVVDIEPVGDGRAVLKYLAPYVHRVAISDKRIVKVDESHVTCTVKPSGSERTVTRRIEGRRFVGGFLQHVLPHGLQKVRYYGWQHPNSKVDFEEVQWLACLAVGLSIFLAHKANQTAADKFQPHNRKCERCGGAMRIVRVVNVDCDRLFDHPLPYLDSG